MERGPVEMDIRYVSRVVQRFISNSNTIQTKVLSESIKKELLSRLKTRVKKAKVLHRKQCYRVMLHHISYSP